MHNVSYENEFYLLVNEISFSYERLCTKARFEKEVHDNWSNHLTTISLSLQLFL